MTQPPRVCSISLVPKMGTWASLYAHYCSSDVACIRQVPSGHKDRAALKAALDAWFDEVRKARWSSTAEVKRSNTRLLAS